MSCNDESDEREAMPCAAGLMAATLALMTAWAAPEPDAAIDADTRRALIANKIVSNLFFLREHPQVGPALRGVVRNAHERWARVARGGAGGPAATAAHAAVAAWRHYAMPKAHVHWAADALILAAVLAVAALVFWLVPASVP